MRPVRNMDERHRLDDPLAAAVTELAADDMAYWLAHPELQGLVAHFMAKGENLVHFLSLKTLHTEKLQAQHYFTC